MTTYGYLAPFERWLYEINESVLDYEQALYQAGEDGAVTDEQRSVMIRSLERMRSDTSNALAWFRTEATL